MMALYFSTLQAFQQLNSNHQIHESRSLRMHRKVAELLRQDPKGAIRYALGNLDRWQLQGVECDDFEIWRKILLAGPSDKLLEALIGMDDEAVRLRQSSPFAGMVSNDDRQQILSYTR